MRTLFALSLIAVGFEVSAAVPPILRNAYTTNQTPALSVVTNTLGLTGSTSTFLRSDGTQTTPAGGGNVSGPGSATDNAITRFDGASGTIIQNSVVLIGDSGIVSGVNSLTSSNAITASDFIAGTTNFVAAVALKAPLASPPLTGTPTVPNLVLTDSSTTIPNSAFVKSNITALSTSIAASNIVSGGQLPIGTLAPTNGAAFQILGFDGTERIWENIGIGLTNTGNTTLNAALAAGTNTVFTTNGNTITINNSASGGSGSPGGSDTQLQFNDASAFGGAVAATWNKTTSLATLGNLTVTTNAGFGTVPITAQKLTLQAPSLGTSPIDGIFLTNNTAAANNAQQYSPSLYLSGNAWATTPSASVPISFRQFVLPLQGTAGSGTWTVQGSISNAAFVTALGVTTGGALTSGSSITSGAQVNAAGTSYLGMSGRGAIFSSAAGALEFRNSSSATANSTAQFDLKQLTKTSNYTIAAALDSGQYINNIGASGAVTNTLPTAVAGQHYWFYVDAAQIMSVKASGSDTIRYGSTVSATAGDIYSNAVGSTLHVFSPKALVWIVDQLTGTWTGPQ